MWESGRVVPCGLGGVGRAQTVQGFEGDERELGFLLRAMRSVLGNSTVLFSFCKYPCGYSMEGRWKRGKRKSRETRGGLLKLFWKKGWWPGL